MDRAEFIRDIMSLYPNIFDVNNEAQFTGWISKYQVIPETWNFDKLMNIFSTKWTSVREAPPPSWFLSFREDVKPVKEKRIEIHEPTDEEKENVKKILAEFKKRVNKVAKEHSI